MDHDSLFSRRAAKQSERWIVGRILTARAECRLVGGKMHQGAAVEFETVPSAEYPMRYRGRSEGGGGVR
jgi:hypothetical protein